MARPDFKFAILACLLLAATGGAQGADPPGVEAGLDGDNDPVIHADEVVAPETDWQDAGWKPFYERYEDPASVNCGGRRQCEAAKQNATADGGGKP